MKKKLLIIVLTSVLFVNCTACGNNNSGNSRSTSAPEISNEEPETSSEAEESSETIYKIGESASLLYPKPKLFVFLALLSKLYSHYSIDFKAC